MESVIKWQTGEPTKEGWYIVSIKDRGSRVYINTDYWIDAETQWISYDKFRKEKITAWYPLNEIKPYKE